MTTLPKLLSKTKILRGYRCEKCLYLTVHHPKLESEITEETQALFDQGNQVGKKAREYYPGGVLVDNKPWDFFGALAKTKELIARGETILYEAAFEYKGCYARVDIMRYSSESQRWQIGEVKSTTKVKPEHYDDAGIQAWIIAKSGLPIERISLIHLNPECRYPDLSNLFVEVDITEPIRQIYLSIQPKINYFFSMLQNDSVPNVDIGSYCLQPNQCGFTKHCWQEKKIPDVSVFNLPRIGDKKWDLYYQGILSLSDPRLTDLNELQQRMVSCFKENKRYIDLLAIRNALSEWHFPFIFLDFETINPAIPAYNGTRPFEQVPFQFSVHYWKNNHSELKHIEFLYTDENDPRPTLIPALLDACGKKGAIIAYFGRFESERIQALAQFSPTHSDELLDLTKRIVDPLPIIRDHIYDNEFFGSFSLKKVAPALLSAEYSYDGMRVANGNAAQRAYEKLIAKNTTDTQKETLKKALLDYCKMDTLVMVELVKWLIKSSE
jgi:hypothetical protein